MGLLRHIVIFIGEKKQKNENKSTYSTTDKTKH